MSMLPDGLEMLPLTIFPFVAAGAAMGWSHHTWLCKQLWFILPVAVPFGYFMRVTFFPDYFIADVLVVGCIMLLPESMQGLMSLMERATATLDVQLAGVAVYAYPICVCTMVNLSLAVASANSDFADLLNMLFENMVTTINVKNMTLTCFACSGWTDHHLLVLKAFALILLELGEWKLLGAPGQFPFHPQALWSWIGACGMGLMIAVIHWDSHGSDPMKKTRHQQHALYASCRENVKDWLGKAIETIRAAKRSSALLAQDIDLPWHGKILLWLSVPYPYQASRFQKTATHQVLSIRQKLENLLGSVEDPSFEQKLCQTADEIMKSNCVNIICWINQNPRACQLVLGVTLVSMVIPLLILGKGHGVFRGLACIANGKVSTLLLIGIVTLGTWQLITWLIVKKLQVLVEYSDDWQAQLQFKTKDLWADRLPAFPLEVKTKDGKDLGAKSTEGMLELGEQPSLEDFPLCVSFAASHPDPPGFAAGGTSPEDGTLQQDESLKPSAPPSKEGALQDQDQQCSLLSIFSQTMLGTDEEPTETAKVIYKCREHIGNILQEKLDKCGSEAMQALAAEGDRLAISAKDKFHGKVAETEKTFTDAADEVEDKGRTLVGKAAGSGCKFLSSASSVLEGAAVTTSSATWAGLNKVAIGMNRAVQSSTESAAIKASEFVEESVDSVMLSAGLKHRVAEPALQGTVD